MAREKFLIVAIPAMDDCFTRFKETENREAIEAGTMGQSDPYAWIEQTFEVVLVRYREATHLCSLTPSARQEFLQNVFVGDPNEAWQEDGDPEGLEYENGGELSSYGTYRDEYDPRFICGSFEVDTMKELATPMRAPTNRHTEYAEKYLDAIWAQAKEVAGEAGANGGYDAPIFGVYTYRQWEREVRDQVRARACEASKRYELRIF